MRAEKIVQLLAELQALPPEPPGSHLSDEEFVAFVLEEMAPAQEARIEAHLATCPHCTEELDAFFTAAETFPQAEWAQQRPAVVQRLRARLQEEGLRARPAAPLSGPLARGEERLAAPQAAAAGSGPAAVSPPRADLEAPQDPSAGPSLRDRVWAALQQAAADFARIVCGPQTALAAPRHRPIWTWQSPDGLLRGHAVREHNNDWTFRFASPELRLEGRRFTLCLGPLRREGILERVSLTEVGTKVVVQRHERPAHVTPEEIVFAVAE